MQSYFPWYVVQPTLFQGELKYVNLKLNKNEFILDWEEVEKQCSEKTRFILINSPHNPTGKIFKESDFKQLSNILEKFPNIIVLSDEVYEMVSFIGQFPRIANYQDMWKKVISIFSGGKTFSCTGWRIGWAIGPKELIDPLKEK